MILLAIGDICAENGISFLESKLPSLKRQYGADMVIANGENSAPGGVGITVDSIHRIFGCGVDVITTGNHSFDMQGYENLYENTEALIRPCNLGKGIPGKGVYTFDMGRDRVLVANFMGNAFIRNQTENCYDVMDKVLMEADTPIIVVDFHAESTSEKIAFARNYDGRASLIFGTHTHVATADETIFPNGTAYVTDIGMTGAKESVIGVEIEGSIKKQRYSLPIRFIPAKGPSVLTGIVSNIDSKTGKALSIERISLSD